MVEIECPHCSEELEMEDDAYGLFECPYCDGEYEWGEEPKIIPEKKKRKYNFKSRNLKEGETRQKRSSGSSVQKKPRREYNTDLEYTALNFTSFAINVVLLFIVIIGLNSNSWYGFSHEEKETEGEIEANFGTSYVEYTITEYERDSYYDEDLTYYYFAGSMVSYESQFELAKGNLESVEEMCKDWDENDRCDTMITQAEESVDFWNSLDSAGGFLFGLLVFTLIFLLLTLSFKLLILLNHNGWLSSNDELMSIIARIENIATLVICSVLSIGLLMYWLFLPNIENWWDILDETVPSGLSSGLGLIWWVTLLTSLGLVVSSTIESIAKRNA